MWIVALALRRPYTFVVMALVIIILTPITILRTPVDIFPDINIPVISVVWSYRRDVARARWRTASSPIRSAASPSRSTTSSTSNRSRCNGIGVIKIFFRPGVEHPDGDGANDGDVQTVLRGLPPGTVRR